VCNGFIFEVSIDSNKFYFNWNYICVISSREQRKVVTIDGRESAPIHATQDMFLNKGPELSHKGKNKKLFLKFLIISI
jgi:hypothetical protein